MINKDLKDYEQKAKEIEDLFIVGNSQLQSALYTMKLVKQKIRDLKGTPALKMLPEGFIENLLGGIDDETRN
mgnify:CR=1 FL=1|tara:strand:+ start:404 stop:619 length:216 start_codon:yes stop_codon:yes gene_type:complete